MQVDMSAIMKSLANPLTTQCGSLAKSGTGSRGLDVHQLLAFAICIDNSTQSLLRDLSW